METRKAVALLFVVLTACSRESSTSGSEIARVPIPVGDDLRASRTFVAPNDSDHFLQPAGSGQLRICRSPNNSIRSAVTLPAGSNFSDVGVVDQPPETSGGWWLLQVQTTETVSLADNQDCATVTAHVVPTEIPSNYSDMASLTRFRVSDRRHFEYLASSDELDRIPALLLLNATAVTDFE